MDKTIASMFVMGLDANEQTVYVDQNDPTRSYIFDEDGNLVQNQNDDDDQTDDVKLESSNNEQDDNNDSEENLDENSSSNMLQSSMPTELNDHSLVLLNGLDEVSTFEECLMPELDSSLEPMDTVVEDTFIMQHMDIREPLNKLRKLLENRLDTDLSLYQFTLQETQVLEGHKNLVDQCVQGEGVVQVNAQIQNHLKRINIVDVLKPAEDYMDMETTDDVKPHLNDDHESCEKSKEALYSRRPSTEINEEDQRTSSPQEKKVIHQWQVDNNFKAALTRLKIPSDPEQWSVTHVRHWIQWAVRQFNLPHLRLSQWSMTGADLFAMDIHRFQKIVPNDPGDVFWTHFELLRKMRVVAVIKKDRQPNNKTKPSPKLTKQSKIQKSDNTNDEETMAKSMDGNERFFTTVLCGTPVSFSHRNASTTSGSTSTTTSGHVQLWQFLLELLTSRQYKSVISWLGNEGEFFLIQPEMVAQLWGERKNKPTMNYEKLSRALRYYYDGDMISKVPRKRFVYKFVCDLKQLLGYSSLQLSNLVSYGNPNAGLTGLTLTSQTTQW